MSVLGDYAREWLAADTAFERALDSGRLSHDPKAPNYVGHYMFMGPARDGRDAFKHRDTREYIA